MIQDGSLQCPTCKTIYGEKTGTQPPGKMEYHVIPHCLPGYPDSKSIRIVYDIPAGIQVRSQLECKSALMALCLDPPPPPLYDSFIVDIAENIHRGREALIC